MGANITVVLIKQIVEIISVMEALFERERRALKRWCCNCSNII